LNQRKSILENVIISSCNRTEIYVVADQLHTGRYFVKQFLAYWFNVPMDKFSSYLQIVDNDDAIEHLLRVATGLYSMVLGDTGILGEVSYAFFLAQDNKTTRRSCKGLLNRVISFGKNAHSTRWI